MSRKTASKRQLKTGLTPLEERFCNEYVVDFVASYALKRAGSQAKYIDQQASEMLRKPHIVERISALIAQQNEKAIVNKQWIMTELVLVYRSAIAAANAPGGNASERKTALQALEKLGQHVDVNAFRQQVGLGNPDGTPFNYEALSDDDLDILEGILRKAALSAPEPLRLGDGTGETAH